MNNQVVKERSSLDVKKIDQRFDIGLSMIIKEIDPDKKNPDKKEGKAGPGSLLEKAKPLAERRIEKLYPRETHVQRSESICHFNQYQTILCHRC